MNPFEGLKHQATHKRTPSLKESIFIPTERSMNARDELTAKVMSWMQLTRDMPQENLSEAQLLARHFERELKRLAKKGANGND